MKKTNLYSNPKNQLLTHKFNFEKNGGGQIKFCFKSFLMFIASFFLPGISEAQTLPTPISGESLFRTFNFGVANHCISVDLSEIGDPNGWIPQTHICSPDCLTPVYDGSISMKDLPTTYAMRVNPKSINDSDDYLNGVTTADIVIINKHILGQVLITDGCRIIAADPDGDHAITNADIEQVRDLILGVIARFTRNSWEWFHPIVLPPNFDSNPWNYCISENWPDGIIFPGVMRQQVMLNPSQFFDYRSTKVGEVKDGGTVSQNSWVCGFYLRNPQVSQSRTNIDNIRIMKDTKFKLNIDIKSDIMNCVAYQIPISIDPNLFNVEKVQFSDHKNINYFYNKERKNLVFLMHDVELKESNIIAQDSYVTIELSAKQDLLLKGNDFKANQIIEFVDKAAETINHEIEFSLSDFNSEDIQIAQNQSKVIDILSPLYESLDFKIYDLNGRNVFEDHIINSAGMKQYDLKFLETGVYIAVARSNGKMKSIKIII